MTHTNSPVFLHKLEKFLRQRDLKMTTQRKVILEVLESLDHHVTLEELLEKVLVQQEGIGLATIYRTMKLFTEAGITEERRFDDGITRYEIFREGEHHDHLICTECGLIIEFENKIIEEQQNLIAKHYGIQIVSHKLELYGRCVDKKACASRKNAT